MSFFGGRYKARRPSRADVSGDGPRRATGGGGRAARLTEPRWRRCSGYRGVRYCTAGGLATGTGTGGRGRPRTHYPVGEGRGTYSPFAARLPLQVGRDVLPYPSRQQRCYWAGTLRALGLWPCARVRWTGAPSIPALVRPSQNQSSTSHRWILPTFFPLFNLQSHRPTAQPRPNRSLVLDPPRPAVGRRATATMKEYLDSDRVNFLIWRSAALLFLFFFRPPLPSPPSQHTRRPRCLIDRFPPRGDVMLPLLPLRSPR